MIRERSFNTYFSYFLTVASVLIAVFMALLVLLALVQPAQAQTFTVLYTFTGLADGGQPYGDLFRDAAGNIYGTTGYFGRCSVGGKPCRVYGTVFKLDQAGRQTVLHTFTGADGAYPYAGVIRDRAGNLYGTTPYGGLNACPVGTPGCGVLFKLDPTSNETLLHAFTGAADGARPVGDLMLDVASNLYGTTSVGGAYNSGTVFKLDPTGTETVLYSFAGGTNGANPYAGLVADSAGNLYGTTIAGGDFAPPCVYLEGCGVVFKLDPAGHETVLHAFNLTDGDEPLASLVRDTAGNLYSTTYLGGNRSCPQSPIGLGCGVVFKLDPAGHETVLHAFSGGADGAHPFGGLALDAAGNLYGVTRDGGSGGCGVVFKVDAVGNETMLHTFTGGADGAWPNASLVEDAAGNLYGTASGAGAYGRGTVFKISFP